MSVVAKTPDECFIKLQNVEFELHEQSIIRVIDAKIVDSHTESARAQTVCHLPQQVVAPLARRLGQLDLDERRIESVSAHRVSQAVDEAVVARGQAREVHRDRHDGAPFALPANERCAGTG